MTEMRKVTYVRLREFWIKQPADLTLTSVQEGGLTNLVPPGPYPRQGPRARPEVLVALPPSAIEGGGSQVLAVTMSQWG